MPRPLVPPSRSNTDKTDVSVPHSAIADVNLVMGGRFRPSSATGLSTPDSIFDVKSPSGSETSTLAVRKLRAQSLD